MAQRLKMWPMVWYCAWGSSTLVHWIATYEVLYNRAWRRYAKSRCPIIVWPWSKPWFENRMDDMLVAWCWESWTNNILKQINYVKIYKWRKWITCLRNSKWWPFSSMDLVGDVPGSPNVMRDKYIATGGERQCGLEVAQGCCREGGFWACKVESSVSRKKWCARRV